MTAESNSTSMTFYHENAVEDWTYAKLTEHYRAKMKENQRKLLDSIKKDLQKVVRSVSEFDETRRHKAQEILDHWKNWTAQKEKLKSSNPASNVQLQVKKVKQLNNLSGYSATQNIDNRRTTSGKRQQGVDNGEETVYSEIPSALSKEGESLICRSPRKKKRVSYIEVDEEEKSEIVERVSSTASQSADNNRAEGSTSPNFSRSRTRNTSPSSSSQSSEKTTKGPSAPASDNESHKSPADEQIDETIEIRSDDLEELENQIIFSSFTLSDNNELGEKARRIFNYIKDELPLMSKRKETENKHCVYYLDPFIKIIFGGEYTPYTLELNKSVNGKQRPDFSCVIDNIAVLNSEIKPLGYTQYRKDQDFVKVHLKGKKSINQLLEKGGPNKSIAFLNMGDTVESFVIDLAYDGHGHQHVNEIINDYENRPPPGSYTPPEQVENVKFIRKMPTTPQLKLLLKQ
ncbi:7623_t:CDS:2 [Funneliformis mosseae]|uniref:7623_t:CDS:1 n=1 Tax=Funneliformis mosseae TaxID=27381 RepID=A0A9N9BJ70_FUNMO|nr:7623_t:CDS:2 [Funneliformis mosseae]